MGRIKGPAPCGVGPFISDSVMVALHAHGGGAPAQGGGVAVMWVGLVGIDWARTSDIQFHPFENSWLNVPQEGHHLGVRTPYGGGPFTVDPMMTVRRSVVCQIGGVLTGYVISQEPENCFVGFKETSSQRLYDCTCD